MYLWETLPDKETSLQASEVQGPGKSVDDSSSDVSSEGEANKNQIVIASRVPPAQSLSFFVLG